jgi:hypothetical protein
MPTAIFGSGIARHILQRLRWRHLLLVNLTVILALILFHFALPPKPGLDPSWNMVLVYAHRHHLQFVPDIAFTYGPLGFLLANFYYDGVCLDKILWETVGRLALAATLIAIAASRFGWIRFSYFYLGLLLAAKIVLVASAKDQAVAGGVSSDLAGFSRSDSI